MYGMANSAATCINHSSVQIGVPAVPLQSSSLLLHPGRQLSPAACGLLDSGSFGGQREDCIWKGPGVALCGLR